MNKGYLIGAVVVIILILLWTSGVFATPWKEPFETADMKGNYYFQITLYMADGTEKVIDRDSPPISTWWHEGDMVTAVGFSIYLHAILIDDSLPFTQYTVNKENLIPCATVTDSEGNVDYTYPNNAHFAGEVTLDIGESQELAFFQLHTSNTQLEALPTDTYTFKFWLDGTASYTVIGDPASESNVIHHPLSNVEITLSKIVGGMLAFSWSFNEVTN